MILCYGAKLNYFFEFLRNFFIIFANSFFTKKEIFKKVSLQRKKSLKKFLYKERNFQKSFFVKKDLCNFAVGQTKKIQKWKHYF